MNNSSKQQPTSVYKYYALNENNCDALAKNYIYGSNPEQLNDQFDCHHKILHSDSIKEIIKSKIPFSLEKDNPEKINKLTHKEIYSWFGIFSTTTKCDNLPMWAHYTKNEGFCIEFDYEMFPKNFEGPLQVKYANQISSVPTQNIWEMLLYSSTIKFLDWQHEDEWRFILQIKSSVSNTDDRKFYYPLNAIKRVILGSHFFCNNERSDNREGLTNINLKSNIAIKELLLNILLEKKITLSIMEQHPLGLGLKDKPYELIKKDHFHWILKARE